MSDLYHRCQDCAAATPHTVDEAAYPALSGKVGVRCDYCGRKSVYTYSPTPDAERQYQATARADAERNDRKVAGGAEAWAIYDCERRGWGAQPPVIADLPTVGDTELASRILDAAGAAVGSLEVLRDVYRYRAQLSIPAAGDLPPVRPS